MTVLAIDQGTTSTRALVLEDSGEATVTQIIQHKQIYPKTHWVEHDPEELITNILQCIEQSLSSYPDIKYMGIDNQGESCLAWHAETKQALSPVIVWQDSRTQDVIDSLKKQGLDKITLDTAGLPLDPYFSASKLGWIIQNIPEVQKALKQSKLRLGTTDAFFLDRLTGKFVTDVTTASRTSLMNLTTLEWDKQLCELFNVPIEILPEIVPSTGDFGTFHINGKTITIRTSICDQQASLFGHGCRKKGDIKITFGTGAFAFAITGQSPILNSNSGLLPTPAWQLEKQQNLFALDGGVYNAGAAINWAKSLGLFDTFDEINQFSKNSAIEEGLVFVPALSGLACPHWDRKAAGLWIGLSLGSTSLDMMQAVLEGVAFRSAEVIIAMQQESTISDQISIDGGLSANPFFCQFLSNVLYKEITVSQFPEVTALGTAQLASGKYDKPQANDESKIHYLPKRDMRNFLNKFTHGVEYSKGWFETEK
ncbi:MAG: FGGY family carbohydrate kinase [Cocleimonas sp.]